MHLVNANVATLFFIILGVCTLTLLGQVLLQQRHDVPSRSSNSRLSTTTTSSSSSSSSVISTNPLAPNRSFTRFVINSSEWWNVVSSNEYDDDLITPWRRTKRPLCSRSQVINGTWVATQLSNGPLYITPTVHLRCYPREHFDQRPFPTWKWVPRESSTKTSGAAAVTCEWTTWRSTTFCNMLPAATVLIIGDSLSWEHYASLVQLLGIHTHQGYQHQSKQLSMNIGQAVCDGKTRILYRRDDRLQNVTGALVEASEPPPTVLILNRGAHYVNDTLLLQDIRTVIQEIKVHWWEPCQRYGLTCHLFWRTSVPGHPHCGNFTQPVNDLVQIQRWIENPQNYDNKTMQYHWQDYQHQNELVLHELEQSGLPFRILDAYYLNVRRPDEHRAHQGDCLHNCYPGKMDVFSQLLLHSLRQDRSLKQARTHVHLIERLGWLHKINVTTVYDKNATERAQKARFH